MDAERMSERLAEGGRLLRAHLEAIDAEEAIWRPPGGGWTVLEIAGHLFDEEREDFRARLDLLLHRPGEPWPGIDPEKWVTERRYAERDLGATLEAFLEERRRSVDWLHSLRSPDWSRVHVRPNGTQLSAGDLLASWIAHDVLHLRQLVRRRFEYGQALASPYATEYAGKW